MTLEEIRTKGAKNPKDEVKKFIRTEVAGGNASKMMDSYYAEEGRLFVASNLNAKEYLRLLTLLNKLEVKIISISTHGNVAKFSVTGECTGFYY